MKFNCLQFVLLLTCSYTFLLENALMNDVGVWQVNQLDDSIICNVHKQYK